MVKPIRVTLQTADEHFSSLPALTRLLAGAALGLGYTVKAYPGKRLFSATHNRKTHHFTLMRTPLNSYAAASIADNKHYTNLVLYSKGVPVPYSEKRYRHEYKERGFDFSNFHFPVVVKPASGTIRGEFVKVDVKTERHAHKLLKTGFQKYVKMLVEEYYEGLNDYRLLVLDNRVIAATYRVPAHVIGDGRSSVRWLMHQKNEQRAAVKAAEHSLITYDAEMKKLLRSQRLNMSSVPSKGRYVQLKKVPNLGAGGEAHDVTDIVHPDNIKLAIKATKALGLRLAGLDFLCDDISKPIEKTNGVILEVNQHPGIIAHHFPHKGEPRDVATQIMKAVFK